MEGEEQLVTEGLDGLKGRRIEKEKGKGEGKGRSEGSALKYSSHLTDRDKERMD